MSEYDERMLFEANRLATFGRWPYDDSVKCNPGKMAEAGFYACGGADEPDLARCFLCGKEMDGWESTDDPWLEHRDHAKQCMFVQLHKREGELTVAEFLGVTRQFVINMQNKHFDAEMKEFEKIIHAKKIELLKS